MNISDREREYEDITIKVLKGKKDLIQMYAESRGETIDDFINRGINKEMGIEPTGIGYHFEISIPPKKLDELRELRESLPDDEFIRIFDEKKNNGEFKFELNKHNDVNS